MLLAADDLPAGMTSDGITDGSAFTIDTADFAAGGGLAIAEQTWSAHLRAEQEGIAGTRLEDKLLVQLADLGLAVAEQTWSAQTAGPVLRVFDFRFLFPSAEAAQAYLDVAGPTLSEAAGGLSEVSGDIQIGDGYRHFAGETAVSDPSRTQRLVP